MDRIEIEILDDGTIRATTDKISKVNHSTAEAFMAELARAGGEKQERRHKAGIIGEIRHQMDHLLGRAHTH